MSTTSRSPQPAPMTVGLCLPQIGPHCDAGAVATFARTAEELGYSSLWVGDRLLAPVAPSTLYPGGGTPEQPYPSEFTAVLDPLVTLTVAATATTSVRLGTSTLNATWHNPALLARTLTTLDAVSDGRLDVGLGLSWLPEEYEAAGVPWAGRGARLEEILDVLDAWWTRNPVEHHGERFDIARSIVGLRPVQLGGPPVLLGGMTVAGMERIGRRAAGWLPLSDIPAPYQDQLWQVARRTAETAGRDPDALRQELRINAHPGRTTSQLVTILEEARARGVHSAFYDLSYVTGSVEESLDLAARLIKEYESR
jgi:probable F420-dependent oxidoreductase